MKLILPRKEHLTALKYEYIDSTIDQYYRPVQGHLMRKRLTQAMALIPNVKVDRILDVGYGGGQFIPTLAQISKEPIYGIDTLPQPERVAKILKQEGYATDLIEGSVFKMPYKDNYFDGLVCISVMEHFEGDELWKATQEMLRVLKPGGWLVIGSPVKNPMTDFIIDHFLGFKPDDIHPSGHKQIIAGIEKITPIDKLTHFFWWMPLDWSLYFCARIIKTNK
ncbi:MAG: SAM-dependent methyltransferase, ubiE/COQ5 family [Candidatus Berkelbacteria bacterium Gr01-1014_85]|uniref:SAM-dependent methyltransferase, ubiE/COQ5 family n=1 Tax=Candidatus Berkelbacteria bacterium Gr01-1014_85 TaxID=2017150 RepID=A0A554JDE4_9BACT|nr:MAG: SAM-dependent methyltransferase, ubiE/COQ5 family [Candidatus Berkelbacteria bacterium Gr01-1014_85]